MSSVTERRDRSRERRGFDDPTRLRLLEGDADGLEEKISEVLEELKSMRRLLVGILASVTTGALLLAANVLVIGTR